MTRLKMYSKYLKKAEILVIWEVAIINKIQMI
jgi:hypothetical protein